MLMFQNQPITTILFDLDGTLRHSIPYGDVMMLDYATSLGAPNDPENRRAARRWVHHYWANSECLLLDEQTYGRGETAFWENYARRMLTIIKAPSGNINEWATLTHQYMRECYQPDDLVPGDVIPTLQALRKAGCSLGVITNRTHSVDEYLDELGLREHLDFNIAAGEIGTWKPDREIFFYAVGTARTKPQNAIYVGDNYYADVEGARKAGLQPILIDPDDIFHQPDCPVIQQISEILPLLELA